MEIDSTTVIVLAIDRGSWGRSSSAVLGSSSAVLGSSSAVLGSSSAVLGCGVFARDGIGVGSRRFRSIPDRSDPGGWSALIAAS